MTIQISPTRRTMLLGLSGAPLLASPLALCAAAPASAAPEPAMLDYVTWLAHEHLAALRAYSDAKYAHLAPHGRYDVPYCWIPDNAAIEALVASGSPFDRAGPVLAAVRNAPANQALHKTIK